MKIAVLFAIGLASAVIVTSPAGADTFSGPYVGADVGWSDVKVGNPLTNIGRPGIYKSRDAVEGDVFAGYNYKPTALFVLSAEGGFRIAADDAVRGSSATINPSYSFDLGVRAGYLVTDRTLLYVRGGYTNMRASVQITQLGKSSYGRENFDGWTMGGGVERAITKQISVRAEYRYGDLRKEGTFYQHQLLVGAAYHF
jgi:outer membrane immunogenic protein